MTSSDRPDRRRLVREEHVTATGWRITGHEAVELVARAAEEVELPVGRDADVLFAARFTVRPLFGSGSAVKAILEALGSAIAREWEGAPPLTRDRPLVRRAARFAGLRWDVLGEPGSWTGELTWRHPHGVVAGAACTTHVILVEQSGHTTLSIRVTADGGLASVRGLVGAGQARPSFLSDIGRACRMTFDGGDAAPTRLDEHTIDGFVREVLLSETRQHPVAVLAPLEEGGYVVQPAELAAELLGVARIHYLERHQSTFRLTDALGDRRLSAYWGALRVYMPDFSCADDTANHPLLVRDRLIDPVIRAELVGRLGRFAAARVKMPPGVAVRRDPSLAESPATPGVLLPTTALTLSDPRVNAADPARQVAVPSPTFTLPPELLGIGDHLQALTAQIVLLVEAQGALLDEVARLRTTTAVRAANTTSLERRIGSLERLLARHLPPATGTDTLPTPSETPAPGDPEREEDVADGVTLVDTLRQAAASYPDELLILENAERSARESPYDDPDRVAVILDAMAQVARRRQAGALGTSLREAFREFGIDYRGDMSKSTSKKLRQQYLVRGGPDHEYECSEHIVLGNSYDPKYCLRIYFTSRAPVEPRLVIGHVGRHFDVVSTT